MRDFEHRDLTPLTPKDHSEIDKAGPRERGPVVSSLLDTDESSDQGAVLEGCLKTVAQKGMRAAGLEVVKAAAICVWHGNHVPQEPVFQGLFAMETALLVERLAFYAIVPQPRKKALLSLVSSLLPADGSASRTAFNTEFKRYLPELQPLQTRHSKPS